MERELEQIWQVRSPKLRNLDVKNPKVIVAFSGVPGSGKTRLARKIERKFGGIRLSNYWLRTTIDRLGLADTPDFKQQLVQADAEFVIKKLKDTPNGMLIFDSSIDRKHDMVAELAGMYGYRLVVISLVVSRSTVERRIRERTKSRTRYQDYLENMERWIADNQKLNARVKADLVINNEDESEHGRVLEQLEKIIQAS